MLLQQVPYFHEKKSSNLIEGHLYKLNTGTFCTKCDLFLSSAVTCMVTLMVSGYICTCFLSLAQKDNLRQKSSGFFYHIYRAIRLCVVRQSKCLLQHCPQKLSTYACEKVLHYSLHPLFFFSKLEKTSLGTHFFACTFFCRGLSFLGAPWGSGLPCDPTGLLPLGAERLVNTCTIDNFITILNFILFEFAAAKDFFTSSLLPILLLLSISMSWQWKAIGMQPS